MVSVWTVSIGILNPPVLVINDVNNGSKAKLFP